MILEGKNVHLTESDEAAAYGNFDGNRGIDGDTTLPIIMTFTDTEAAQAVANHLANVLNPQA